jgi:hypothetical protein
MHLNVTLQVRSINADDYADAKARAFEFVQMNQGGVSLLEGILTDITPWRDQWSVLAKVAKEADGTFTVTVP